MKMARRVAAFTREPRATVLVSLHLVERRRPVLYDVVVWWAISFVVLSVLLVVVMLMQAVSAALRELVTRPRVQPVRLVEPHGSLRSAA